MTTKLQDALDEIMGRAEGLDGISEGTQDALERVAEALDTDHGTVQAARAARSAQTLSEPLDPRGAFFFDEEGGDDDTLVTLSHDLDVLAVHADDLVGRGLLSGSTRALLQHAARSMRSDLEASDSADSESIRASEWDDGEDEEGEEGESPDLWPDADRIAQRRYGIALDDIKLTDPDLTQRLLYEAERRRG